MVGLKCVFLLSLVASAFVVGNAESNTLETLLRRMLDQLHARSVEAAKEYVNRVMLSSKSGADGKSDIRRLSVVDMTSGKLLASGAKGEVPLTDTERTRLAAAVKNSRFQVYDSAGLKIGDETYRLYISTTSGPLVQFGSRTGTVVVKKTSVGAVVALVDKLSAAARDALMQAK